MSDLKIAQLTPKATPTSADLIEIVDTATGQSASATLGVLPVPAHNHAAADIVSGTIAPARLGSGTPDATKVLRGDSTWQVAADASTNTATSVDGEAAVFSGTGGKTLKRATGSGVAKLTSGVLGVATAGTDYAPATPGLQTPAFAASFTPAPTGAQPNIKIGALTGNITVNAVASPVTGMVMTLIFTEDATGGRTITFNAAYKTNWTPNTAAGKLNIISFIFDGSNWLQVSSTVGL